MKRKRLKSIIALACATIMSFSLVGCGGSSSGDSSDKVTQINMAIIGDMPKHIDNFYKKLDALTEKDLKIKVRFQNITWQDLQTKYNLALTSGNLDIVPSGNWLSFAGNAKKNAFMDITDKVKSDTPDLYNKISKQDWAGDTIDGKIYGVPQTEQSYGNALGFQYRDDLRIKYNLPEIKDLDTLEQYLTTLKKNEKDMPYVIDQDFVTGYEQAATGLMSIEADGVVSSGISQYGLFVDPSDVSKSVSIFDKPEYKDLLKRVKKWTDEGLINKNVLAGQEKPEDMAKAGSLPGDLLSYFEKSKDWGYQVEKDHPNWKMAFWMYSDKNIVKSRTGQTCEVILRNSKHPDLALKFLQKVRTDRTYFDLMNYGIKGTNYNLTSDGKIDMSKISDEYKFNLTSCWQDIKFTRKGTNEWSKSPELEATFKDKAKNNPLNGFYFDSSSVQTEIANLEQVRNQYLAPIQNGISKDPEKDLQTAVEKFKAAGIDKVKAELDKQLKAFAKSKK